MHRSLLPVLLVVAQTAVAAAHAQIILGPPRPLTSHVRTGPVPAYAHNPVAASSGDQFLVAWNDTRVLDDAYGTVQATRVSPDGTVLDPAGLRFPFNSGRVVGVGSSGQEYLVVTTSAFFIVSRDGEVTRGDPFNVANYPDYVVSNGTDYVIASNNGSDSFRIDRNGHRAGNISSRTVRLAVGRNYVVFDQKSGRMSVIAPDGTVNEVPLSFFGQLVGAAAGNDEIALLVRTGADRIMRFRLDGTQIGDSIPVVLPVALDKEQVAIGWNGTSYVVFYTGDSSFIAADRGAGMIPEALSFAARYGKIASSARGALIVWADARFAKGNDEYVQRQIVALSLPPGADPAAAHDVIVSLSEHAQVSPRIDMIGGRQLVAFIEQSGGASDEIVVVPANGGDEELRIGGSGRLHGLRAATDGNEWFLLWSEDDGNYGALVRAALVTSALQATKFEIGTVQWYLDEPNVMWNGTEYLVFGGDPIGGDPMIGGDPIARRFARDGTPLPPPFPFSLYRIGIAPAAASADGRVYVVDATPRYPPFDAASPWYDISVRGGFIADDEFLRANSWGTAPSIAASGREAVVVTQDRATPIRQGVLWSSVKMASTLAPHVVGRDGAFLVTMAETIAWIRDRDLQTSATLPEAAGGDLGYGYPRRVLESIAPSSGTLTIAYVASALDPRANGTARIWLRDIVGEHHRVVGH